MRPRSPDATTRANADRQEDGGPSSCTVHALPEVPLFQERPRGRADRRVANLLQVSLTADSDHDEGSPRRRGGGDRRLGVVVRVCGDGPVRRDHDGVARGTRLVDVRRGCTPVFGHPAVPLNGPVSRDDQHRHEGDDGDGPLPPGDQRDNQRSCERDTRCDHDHVVVDDDRLANLGDDDPEHDGDEDPTRHEHKAPFVKARPRARAIGEDDHAAGSEGCCEPVLPRRSPQDVVHVVPRGFRDPLELLAARAHREVQSRADQHDEDDGRFHHPPPRRPLRREREAGCVRRDDESRPEVAVHGERGDQRVQEPVEPARIVERPDEQKGGEDDRERHEGVGPDLLRPLQDELVGGEKDACNDAGGAVEEAGPENDEERRREGGDDDRRQPEPQLVVRRERTPRLQQDEVGRLAHLGVLDQPDDVVPRPADVSRVVCLVEPERLATEGDQADRGREDPDEGCRAPRGWRRGDSVVHQQGGYRDA